MQIETRVMTVVQLLLKGSDFDELCKEAQDTWYSADEVKENEHLQRLLAPGTFEMLKQGKIDFIVCRSNWG